jgi:crotonobetainyl-CoA:carnitine CoA-transferase CaiB-like acyl-CoA transferase
LTAPLDGVRVVDFSTLLPGPLAGLILAAAGAEIIKIERPGGGDEMRSYLPRVGSASANFALLNRGKRSVAADLKDPRQAAAVRELVDTADVLIEQFRPGVMDRLGLGYAALAERNPALVYCSISGYGQHGPRAGRAGHDLNYAAETGLLDLARDSDGAPPIPPALIADIAGGAYPALINILLALRSRDRTGRGMHLDVSMAANLFPLQYWALATAGATGQWPRPGGELVTGGSPRYRLYRTADGGWLAAAPLEQRFWERFCELIGLPERFRADDADPEATIAAVGRCVAAYDTAHWRTAIEGLDVCVSVVTSLEDAAADPQFAALFADAGEARSDGRSVPALPLPLADGVRGALGSEVPALGADTDLLGLRKRDE